MVTTMFMVAAMPAIVVMIFLFIIMNVLMFDDGGALLYDLHVMVVAGGDGCAGSGADGAAEDGAVASTC